MYEFCNVASLTLGLLAWVLPGAALLRRGRQAFGCCLVGMLCCTLALLAQLWAVNAKLAINDISALLDTVPALCGAAAVLVAVSAALQAAALCRYAQNRPGR